ncbi:MAG: hypothetical protein R3A10_04365 [Caldilineaceae bacterium]
MTPTITATATLTPTAIARRRYPRRPGHPRRLPRRRRCPVSPPAILISEFMANPDAVADAIGEWLEW